MVVKQELASEFQVELIAGLLDALSDFCGLLFQVLFIIDIGLPCLKKVSLP
jgi:hypothetical protein